MITMLPLTSFCSFTLMVKMTLKFIQNVQIIMFSYIETTLMFVGISL